ncbi:MAG TPA: bifunctional 5,10-methylenetetrahydrofolate dehydrogenase/5,10-methenyltetrahydrofolate cyclohydrolase [Candidatus Saccharimonadales bacterium]|nr:bifunctional 5,10-methylenetetrahydrofolate dehydrogenase/5,10-methenyltetrahydrofolate cyclohydrolase [Candidatus Saccharimonadales bacterium]
MRIDGREIAKEILQDLQRRVDILRTKNIVPNLAIILVGEDPASLSYVKQKVLKASEIGAVADVINLPVTISEKKLLEKIKKLNDDKNVHGIIVQQPLPKQINLQTLYAAINPQKDVDGFCANSPFTMPLAVAVIKILEKIYSEIERATGLPAKALATAGPRAFKTWLQNKNIVVIGKGETGGGPVISLLKKMNCKVDVIDSKTHNPDELLQNADIVITAVGKAGIVRSEMIKHEAVLINVGMHKEADGKLHGDYEEEDIKDIASFYTPTPGGVGPVNVAMLLANVIQSAESIAA